MKGLKASGFGFFFGSGAPRFRLFEFKTGAFIIRIGFWGPIYYNYSKEPPKIV